MDNRTIRLLEYEKIREMLRAHAASSLGKSLVDHMRPARDAAVVRTRMDETTEARRYHGEHGDAPFGGLRDVRDAVRRAEKQGVLSATELLEVADAAACCRRLLKYLPGTEGFPRLRHQRQSLTAFPALEQAIDRAIGPKGEVLDNASPELERARRRVRALHDEIQRELQRIIAAPAMADILQDPIITQRNGRFCVPVRAEARNSFRGIVHDLSASGQTAFMEPLTVMELGNDLREAERLEEEEVYRVLTALSAVVGQVAGRLLTGIDTAARLDLIFARASFARALDAVEPQLNVERVIDLRAARHPLLGANAVPIDVRLGDDGYRTLLITGPNTGGKTVTLKTVGLFILMAQSGLHIPAEPGSRLPIIGQVFADIGDEQSIEQSLSTFSSHMTNIIRIIREAEANALILLDEVGAGTDPAEGAALGKAILLELFERGCLTIATTHYGELKVFGQGTEGFLNASVEFDMQTLRPTYRLITGLPGSSNALAISQRLGLPKPLVARAKEMMGEMPLAFEQVLKQAEGARRALDRERNAAARARQEAEATAAKLNAELREFEEKRTESLRKARTQAQETLQKARAQANSLLDELREAIRATRETATAAPAGHGMSARRRQVHEVLSALAAEVGEAPPTPSRDVSEKPALTRVEAGQSVVVRSLGHRGVALESGQGEEEVEVQVGIMRVRVPVRDLEAATAPSEAHHPATARESLERARHIEPEIHLLGKRAEEAATLLEEYLFEALDGGLAKVRVVHGFGTGALRNVVRDVLRHHAAVRGSRLGEPNEGGHGVTIVDIGLPDR